MITPVLLITAVALAFGRLTGGRIRNLAKLHFRAIPLVLVALGLMVVAPMLRLTSVPAKIVIAVTYLLIATFLVLNVAGRRGGVRAGLAIIGMGWMLNAVVISANGGMPASISAYERMGWKTPIAEGRGGFFKIVIADEQTVLRPLGDVIPMPLFRNVLSAGDLVLLLGLGLTVVAGTRLAQQPG